MSEAKEVDRGQMRFQILSATGLALATLAFPAVARADCQPASSVEDALAAAEIAFVGTVVAAVDDEPGAGFRVEEVWVGELPAAVEVRGMGDEGFMEDDRRWTLGARYLVIPYLDDGVLRDNICSASLEWRDDLAALRPDAHPPEGETDGSGGGVPGAVVALAAAIGVLAIAGVVAFRRGLPTGKV